MPKPAGAIGRYARGAQGIEGVYGIWTLGWEKLTPKSAGASGYAGSYTNSGVRNTGGSYSLDVDVAPGATADTFDLAYHGGTNRFEGVGLAAGDHLAFVRWGRKVTTTDRSWSTGTRRCGARSLPGRSRTTSAGRYRTRWRLFNWKSSIGRLTRRSAG